MENTNMNESAQSTKYPAVSVIVPAYNMEKYIKECLDSLLAQTFKDFEAVCIDDGSTDKSLSIFNEYAARDPRIKVMSQKNQGVVAARNNAIAAANGKYIFPLDSDDIIALDCLEILYNFITKHDYALVSPSGRYFGELEKRKFYRDPSKPTKWNMYRLGDNGIYNSAMYPKKLWEKYGGYDHLFDKGLEDFDFWLNFLDDGQKIIRIPDRLYHYRQKSLEESRCLQAHKKEVLDELRANLCRKHPKIIKYRCVWRFIKIPRSILRSLFHLDVGERGFRIHIFGFRFIVGARKEKVQVQSR